MAPEAGAEEGEDAASRLSRGCCAGHSRWTSWPEPGVEAGAGCWRTRQRPGGCAPFWSTWDCPHGLRSWPRRRGRPKARGAEPKQGLLLPAPLQSSSGAAPRQGRWPGPGWRVSPGDESVLRRPGVRFMGYPSAALTSRSAPALYPQQGSCPSYTSRPSTPSWPTRPSWWTAAARTRATPTCTRTSPFFISSHSDDSHGRGTGGKPWRSARQATISVASSSTTNAQGKEATPSVSRRTPPNKPPPAMARFQAVTIID